jgi:hypothetical protein
MYCPAEHSSYPPLLLDPVDKMQAPNLRLSVHVDYRRQYASTFSSGKSTTSFLYQHDNMILVIPLRKKRLYRTKQQRVRLGPNKCTNELFNFLLYILTARRTFEQRIPVDVNVHFVR